MPRAANLAPPPRPHGARSLKCINARAFKYGTHPHTRAPPPTHTHTKVVPKALWKGNLSGEILYASYGFVQFGVHGYLKAHVRATLLNARQSHPLVYARVDPERVCMRRRCRGGRHDGHVPVRCDAHAVRGAVAQSASRRTRANIVTLCTFLCVRWSMHPLSMALPGRWAAMGCVDFTRALAPLWCRWCRIWAPHSPCLPSRKQK